MRSALHAIAVLALILACSCSSDKVVKPTVFDAEKFFAMANDRIENKEYKEARELLTEVKNRDLTKKYAPLAQLRIADCYIKEEEPELAVAEYRKFIEFYPDHRYAPYAQYQIGLVYFNQIEGYERGYGEAEKALVEFEKLKKIYPRNPYREIVELKIEQCKKIIVDYELMVGEFYMKRDNYPAAIARFSGVLKSYPDTEEKERIYFELATAYKKAGDREKSKDLLNKLLKEYPSGSYAADGKKELSSLNEKGK